MADEMLWTRMLKLYNEFEWSMDEFLQEFTFSRPDMENLLAPKQSLGGGKKGNGKGKGGKNKSNDKNQYWRNNSWRNGKGSQGWWGDLSYNQWQNWNGSSKGGKGGKKGDKGDKGKGKGGKGSKGKTWFLAQKWDTEAWADRAEVDGVSTPFCYRYHLSTCTVPGCRCLHQCPVWLEDGSVCLGKHKAANCPHWK